MEKESWKSGVVNSCSREELACLNGSYRVIQIINYPELVDLRELSQLVITAPSKELDLRISVKYINCVHSVLGN